MSDPQRLELSGAEMSERRVGCIGAEPESGWGAFAGDMIFEQRHRVDFVQMREMGLTVVEELSGPLDVVIVSLGRSRAENMGRIARAARLVGAEGEIIVTGQKTAGVDSLVKNLRKVLPIGDVMSKAHGKLFPIKVNAETVATTQAWFDAAQPAKIDGGWITAPGMFSADAPDPGSVRLSEVFDGRIKGSVADLGAGWGWLSAQALATCPDITELTLHEADLDALAAAKLNVTDPRARFAWSDVTRLEGPATVAMSHDWIISNPPFHHGRAAEPGLGRAFIRTAAKLLKPGGRALFVANRQLPYEAQLTESFKKWVEIPGPGAFKVFEAERPIRAKR